MNSSHRSSILLMPFFKMSFLQEYDISIQMLQPCHYFTNFSSVVHALSIPGNQAHSSTCRNTNAVNNCVIYTWLLNP